MNRMNRSTMVLGIIVISALVLVYCIRMDYVSVCFGDECFGDPAGFELAREVQRCAPCVVQAER